MNYEQLSYNTPAEVKIKCTYAQVFVQTGNGQAEMLHSFQGRDLPGGVIGNTIKTEPDKNGSVPVVLNKDAINQIIDSDKDGHKTDLVTQSDGVVMVKPVAIDVEEYDEEEEETAPVTVKKNGKSNLALMGIAIASLFLFK